MGSPRLDLWSSGSGGRPTLGGGRPKLVPKNCGRPLLKAPTIRHTHEPRRRISTNQRGGTTRRTRPVAHRREPAAEFGAKVKGSRNRSVARSPRCDTFVICFVSATTRSIRQRRPCSHLLAKRGHPVKETKKKSSSSLKSGRQRC